MREDAELPVWSRDLEMFAEHVEPERDLGVGLEREWIPVDDIRHAVPIKIVALPGVWRAQRVLERNLRLLFRPPFFVLRGCF